MAPSWGGPLCGEGAGWGCEACPCLGSAGDKAEGCLPWLWINFSEEELLSPSLGELWWDWEGQTWRQMLPWACWKQGSASVGGGRGVLCLLLCLGEWAAQSYCLFVLQQRWPYFWSWWTQQNLNLLPERVFHFPWFVKDVWEFFHVCSAVLGMQRRIMLSVLKTAGRI